jgi:hypothetical protein
MDAWQDAAKGNDSRLLNPQPEMVEGFFFSAVLYFRNTSISHFFKLLNYHNLH